ncbi:hypothetical protein A2U01_0046205, partial [Trifolium medium]|nr:hypothetical protein [Trifolium medium]
MLAGMIPEKKFDERSRTPSDGQSWNWSGISPSRLFSETMNVCRFGIEITVEGIEEWSLFLDKSMNERDVEEEMSSGIPLELYQKEDCFESEREREKDILI